MNKIKGCNTCQNKVLSKTDLEAECKCAHCVLNTGKPYWNGDTGYYEPYEFSVGDYVETTEGNIGYISYICHCKQCEERGFYEPEIIYHNKENDYNHITCYEAENGFKGYKRLGKYDFTEQQENPKKIEKLPYEKLFEAKDGYGATLKHIWFDTGIKDIIDKLNEVIDRVNEGETK